MSPTGPIFLPDSPNISGSLPRHASTLSISSSASPTLSYTSTTASGDKENRDLELESYSSSSVDDDKMSKPRGHSHRRSLSRVTGVPVSLPSFLVTPHTNRIRPGALILIAICTLGALGWFLAPDARDRVVSRIRHSRVQWSGMRESEEVEREKDVWEYDDAHQAYSEWVRGPATYNYTDNLRDDVLYVTSWVGSRGWTNDVFTIVHLLQLALLTQRVPVVPPFPPLAGRVQAEAGFLPFGEIFDIPRLEQGLHSPVLEWRDVKSPASETVEPLGCWSTWMITGGLDDGYMGTPVPRDSGVPAHLGLDIAYTPVPTETKMYGGADYHINIHRLMALGFPEARALALAGAKTLPSPLYELTLEPSNQMMCFDYLYYTGVETSFEWEKDWSVQWRLVGKHLRWRKEIEMLANRTLRKLLGNKGFQGLKKTPFIAVHARRQDFRQYCAGNSPICLASHAQIQRRVKEVQAELKRTKNIVTERVLVTSDETDPEWWKGIREMGYTPADHKKLGTTGTYGNWYEPILDSVFHSMAAGFVGTEGSTMSLIAEKRVQDWNNGPTARLKWGAQYVKSGVPDPSL